MRQPIATAGGHDSPPPAVPLIWGAWGVAVLCLALTKSPETPAAVGEIAILCHVTLSLGILLHCYHRPLAFILGVSLLLRAALVFWDLNCSHIFVLPNSGADTEMYYHWAVKVGEDPSLVFQDLRGGAFSKLFGMFFWLVGPARAFAQYSIALLGLTIVLLLEATLKRSHATTSQKVSILALAGFLPNSLLISAIFLRETLVAFLVGLSLYFFVRWFRSGNPLTLIPVLAAILAASTFHAGVIAVGFGYMIVIVFYNPRRSRIDVSARTVIYLALFTTLLYFVSTQYPDLFLGKFEQFDSETELAKAMNLRAGGSQYLVGLTVENFGDMLRYGPLRAVYFLGAPLPWDFRGVMDLLTFLADSTIYLGVIAMFCVRQSDIPKAQRWLGYALTVVIGVTALVFGAGVSNAGTALRHRSKFVSLFFLLAGMCIKARQPSAPPQGAPIRRLRDPSIRGTSAGERPVRIAERDVALISPRTRQAVGHSLGDERALRNGIGDQ